MPQAKIAVIGLGLIGTSFGLNLAKNKKRNYTVVGYDIERGRERSAEKAGAIDKRSSSIKDAVSDANVVIIATPILATKTIIDVAALIDQLDLIISPDTSIVHVASALDKPIVSIHENNKYSFRSWSPSSTLTKTVFSPKDNSIDGFDVEKVIEFSSQLLR